MRSDERRWHIPLRPNLFATAALAVACSSGGGSPAGAGGTANTSGGAPGETAGAPVSGDEHGGSAGAGGKGAATGAGIDSGARDGATEGRPPLDQGVDFLVGGAPDSIAIGDLNADGKPDIVVTSGSGGASGTGGVTVFINDGSGTRASPFHYAAGVTPSGVTIGDVSGDGNPDIVVADAGGGKTGTGEVSVLVNRGDGTFAAPVGYAAGATPVSVALGDVNGDREIDLAVASIGSAVGSLDGSLSVLLNVGHGALAAPVPYVPGGAAVALGDVNGDTGADLVALTGEVTVRINDGTGAFPTPTTYADTYLRAASVVLADVNGDAKLDIVAAWNGKDSGPGFVEVFLNASDGTFGTPVAYETGAQLSAHPAAGPPGTGPNAIAVGDLDGDGDVDIAVANSGGSTASGNASVLLNEGKGTFAASVSYLTGTHPVAIALGDLNGDRKLDIAVVDSTSGKMTVLLNPFP